MLLIQPTDCDKTVFSYAQWLQNKTGRGHFGADHGIMKPHLKIAVNPLIAVNGSIRFGNEANSAVRVKHIG